MCVASIIAGAIYCGAVGNVPAAEFVPVPAAREGVAVPGTGLRGPIPTPARYREPVLSDTLHVLCAMFDNDPVQYPHCARYLK